MAIKGIQKRVIVMQTQKSAYFESAFFIVRNNTPKSTNDDAMLIEAQRIIAESDRSSKKPQKAKAPKLFAASILALIIGVFFGAATIGVLWIFVG